MSIRDLWTHEIVDQFPTMNTAEYRALVDDMRARGQIRPIALFEGKIWDGRSRYNACRELQIQPKLRYLLRKDDPIVYLIERHDRYGAPKSPERVAALDLLHKADTRDAIAAAKRERGEWLKAARNEFRRIVGRVRPCAVCDKHAEFAHAHHTLPLNVQYEMGVYDAIQDHEWLCPTHHRHVHMMISVYITDTREGDFLDNIPDEYQAEWKKVETLFEKSRAIFQGLGGLHLNGRAMEFYAQWK